MEGERGLWKFPLCRLWDHVLTKAHHPLYFCQNCKKISYDLNDFLFVEENLARSFCSEKCIENFYEFLVSHFNEDEKRERVRQGLENEVDRSFAMNSEYIEKTLEAPDELWCHEGIEENRFYSFIKSHNASDESFSMVVLCFLYHGDPSFILFSTCSKNQKFIDHYRVGSKIENFVTPKGGVGEDGDSPQESIEVDEETMQIIENKKSNLLADMLEHRSPADIPFESFHLYDEFIEETLSDPDEIYRRDDFEKDEIKIYIKAFDKDGTSFYYFSICVEIKYEKDSKMEIIAPVLCFPTLDGELYNHYRQGERIAGGLKS